MTEPPTNRNNSGPATDGRGPAADGRGEGPITRAAVLNAALEIVDRDGVDGLSMRRLAEAVGRDPMVIYRHVSNKAAVLDGVAEIVFAQLSVDQICERQRPRNCGDGVSQVSRESH
jgi:AcrR family transcriptional regulator